MGNLRKKKYYQNFEVDSPTVSGRFLAALRHGRPGMLPPDTVKHTGQPPAEGRGPAAGGAVRGGRSVKR